MNPFQSKTKNKKTDAHVTDRDEFQDTYQMILAELKEIIVSKGVIAKIILKLLENKIEVCLLSKN